MYRPYDRPLDRRELLWNVLEPGDPYDITKSLIAKIPGDKKPFMGDNIEMVCFLQAAEIQRLIEYLNQYKLKYKEIQKIELDRHSYQVQIKQLAQKCSDAESLRIQISKMKQYMRRMNQQLEQGRNNQQTQELQKKYDDVLNNLSLLSKENRDLQIKIDHLNSNAQGWKTKFEALQKSKQRELQDMRNSIRVQRKTLIDKQQKDHEIQRRFQQQRQQLETQIRRLKDQLMNKTYELQNFRVRLSETHRQANFGTAQLQARCRDLQSMQRRHLSQITTLQERTMSLTYQRDHYSAQIGTTQNQLRNLTSQIRQYQNLIHNNQHTISQLSRNLSEAQVKANQLVQYQRMKEEYQNKIVMMTQQISRLNMILHQKVNQTQQIATKYSRLEYQNQTLRNQSSQFLSRLQQKQQNISRLANDNKRLNNEIMVSSINITEKDQLISQNMQLKRILQQKQLSSEQVVQQIRMSSGLEIQKYVQRDENNIRRINELERAFNTLQSKRNDPMTNIQLADYKEKVLGLSNQNKRIKNDYEQRTISLDRQNEYLKKQLDELRKRISISTQDINSLQGKLRDWERRNLQWISQREELMKQGESNRKPNFSQWQVKSVQYENRIKNLNEQLVGLRNNFQRDDDFYENTIIKQKDQILRLQTKLNNRSQNDTDKIKIQRLERQLSQYIEKSFKAQSQVHSLTQQIDYLSRNSQVNQLNQKIQQLTFVNESIQSKLIKLTQQLDQSKMKAGNNTTLEDLQCSVNNLLGQNDELRVVIRNYQQQNNKFSIQARSHQNQIIDLKSQNENLKIRLQQNIKQVNIRDGIDKVALLESEKQQIKQLFNQRMIEVTQNQRKLRDNVRNLEEQIYKINLQKQLIQSPYQFQQAKAQIKSLTRQIQILRNTSHPRQQSFQEKVINFSNQISRLNARIRSQNQQLVNKDARYNRLIVQKQQIVNSHGSYLRKIQEQQLQIQRLMSIGGNQKNLLHEIQRLNDVLKMKINECELVSDKLRVFQSETVSNKMLMFESQQRIVSISRQIQVLKNQNFNLKNVVQRLNNQIGQYQRVNAPQQKQSLKIFQLQQQNNRLGLLINEFNGKTRLLTQQNEILKRRATQNSQMIGLEMNNQIHFYQQKALDAEQRFNSVIQQLDQLKRKLLQFSTVQKRIPEYQSRIHNLTLQNRKIQQYQQRIKVLTQDLQNIRTQEPNQVLIYQLNQYKQKYPITQNQNKLLQRQAIELTQKLQSEAAARFNVQKQLRSLNQQMQRSRLTNNQQRINEYEIALNNLRQQVESFRRKQRQLTTYLNESNSKVIQLSNQLQRVGLTLKQGNFHQGPNYQNLVQQIQRLNNTLRIKVTQSVEWHNKFMMADSQALGIRQQYQNIKVALKQTGSQADAYRKRIQQHQQKFLRLHGQFQKLSQIIQDLKNQNNALKQQNYNLQNQNQRGTEDKNRVLTSQIQRLTQIIKELQQQISELRIRFVDQNALEKRIKQQLSLLVILFAQIQSLRKRVKDKERQVEQVRRSSLAPFMA